LGRRELEWNLGLLELAGKSLEKLERAKNEGGMGAERRRGLFCPSYEGYKVGIATVAPLLSYFTSYSNSIWLGLYKGN